MRLIRGYTLDDIRLKFFILYILNVTDIIFTLILLRTGFFSEANYFMINIVEKPIGSFMLKAVLPAVLLIYIYIRMKNATLDQLRKSNWLINGIVLFYFLINILHLSYFCMVPIFNNFI